MLIIRRYSLAAMTLLLVSLTPAFAQVAPEPELIEFWNDATPSSGLKPNHEPWQQILDSYLVSDHPSGVHLFDYQGLLSNDALSLANYLAYLQQLDPRQLTRPRQAAYWINLYNASLVALIASNNPGKSIRGLNRGDFWDLDRFNIAGQKLSFNDIEHGVLRPLYQDVRMHFALFRGSVGSANLAAKSYLGDTLDQDLELAAQEFIAHPRAVSFGDRGLRLSRLFKWRQDDFGADREAVKVYIKKYLDPESANKVDQASRIRYQFDWTLNSAS